MVGKGENVACMMTRHRHGSCTTGEGGSTHEHVLNRDGQITFQGVRGRLLPGRLLCRRPSHPRKLSHSGFPIFMRGRRR